MTSRIPPDEVVAFQFLSEKTSVKKKQMGKKKLGLVEERPLVLIVRKCMCVKLYKIIKSIHIYIYMRQYIYICLMTSKHS